MSAACCLSLVSSTSPLVQSTALSQGFAMVWSAWLAQQPMGAVTDRTQKALKGLRDLADSFPRNQKTVREPSAGALQNLAHMICAALQAAGHSDFIALLERIRGKYKQVCAGLPLQARPRTSAVPAAPALSFVIGAGTKSGLDF